MQIRNNSVIRLGLSVELRSTSTLVGMGGAMGQQQSVDLGVVEAESTRGLPLQWAQSGLLHFRPADIPSYVVFPTFIYVMYALVCACVCLCACMYLYALCMLVCACMLLCVLVCFCVCLFAFVCDCCALVCSCVCLCLYAIVCACFSVRASADVRILV